MFYRPCTFGDLIPGMTKEKAEKDFFLHHVASRYGYVSRLNTKGIWYKYSGKFGEGIVNVKPRYDTKQYVYLHYYIAK